MPAPSELLRSVGSALWSSKGQPNFLAHGLADLSAQMAKLLTNSVGKCFADELKQSLAQIIGEHWLAGPGG
jgi:hypothetical protein